MTRETKIGLLVGLAFIIVIGILLSDHMTSSTDPPAAVLASSGRSVRDTITTPGGSTPPVQQITAPQVTPDQRVLTQADLDAQQRAQQIVIGIGPGPGATPRPSGSEDSVIRILNPQVAAGPQQSAEPPAPIQSQPQPQPQPQQNVPSVAQGSSSTGHPIEGIAAAHNEAVVSAYPGNDRAAQPGVRATSGGPSGVLEYTAQPGDNLSRMANRLMGANTRANREAIIKANPSLQANPDMIVVGKTYRIPSAASVAAAPAAPSAAPSSPQPASSGEFWYTVREGDTLTRIARDQLGMNETAIPALIELNRDIIRNPDNLQINTRIRLPGRPVAQIN